MINRLEKLLKSIYNKTTYGFYCICLIFSNGFFFYFYLLSSLLEKVIPCKATESCKCFFKRRQKDPIAFLVVLFIFLVCTFSYNYFYSDNTNIVYVNNDILETSDEIKENVVVEKSNSNNDSSRELNLFRKYNAVSLDEVNFNDLKNVNEDTVAWIMVDGTSINYPVVQTVDNGYYLNHNYIKALSTDGWIFMDYRNSIDISNNTVFYGHNLLNKTAFGSVTNIFTDDWFYNSNHYIVILTENNKYVYEIFSNYIIEPESYYLNNDVDYSILKNRSLRDYNISIDNNDKIITLSTCTDDNMNRRVVHAKLINK